MTFGYILLLICCLSCRDVVLSVEGPESGSEAWNAFPDSNKTQVSPRVNNSGLNETAAAAPEPFAPNNISDIPERENNSSLNGSDDNTNGISTDPNATATVPQTERVGSRRLGSSRYKSGRQQVIISDLAISNDMLRHGALKHKTNSKFDTGKADTEADPKLGQDTGETLYKRKRRIPTSSATPSVQIVILVIGAVLGCVLLTGFIRWRVRGRLNAAKKGKMADDLVIYEGRNVYKGANDMDTIYECDCEEGQTMLSSYDSLDADVLHVEDGSKFDEMPCSHRFDTPSSLMSHTYSAGNNARLVRPKSPKSGRDLRLIREPKRHSAARRKYGYKGRYSRHHRRRLENMYIQKLETIPMENTTHAYEDSELCPTSLLEQAIKNDNRESTNEHHPSSLTSLLRRNSPPSRRGPLASLLNTWRSLSFNRDWVGKMWQEQHNIRRISDVLRGRTTTRDHEAERSPPESLHGDPEANTGVEGQFVLAEDIRFSVSVHRPVVTDSDNSVCRRVNDIDVVTDLNEDKITGNVGEQTRLSFAVGGSTNLASCGIEAGDSNSSGVNFSPNTCIPVTECHQVPQTDLFHNYWSYSDLYDEPPEYESLLGSESQSRSTASRGGAEHPRYQRRNRRKRLDGTERTSRYCSSASRCAVGLGRSESDSILTSDFQEEPSAVTNIHGRYSQHVAINIEPHALDTFSSTAPMHQSELGQVIEQNTGLNPRLDSPDSVSVSPMVAPFVQQEGVIIEQLSDGAQIVYIPPPALPSYHNDTPPPYQQ